MKAFKFSLEQLYKYRKDMTESARLSLAGKVGQITILEQDIERSVLASRENFLSSREQFDAMSLRQSEYYDKYQDSVRQKASQQIRRLEVEKAQVLQLYQERLKGQLVLEHLKERARQKHKREEERIMQIRLDDMINSLVHADKEEEALNAGVRNGRIW